MSGMEEDEEEERERVGEEGLRKGRRERSWKEEKKKPPQITKPLEGKSQLGQTKEVKSGPQDELDKCLQYLDTVVVDRPDARRSVPHLATHSSSSVTASKCLHMKLGSGRTACVNPRCAACDQQIVAFPNKM